jgi:hypothetical protein
MNADASDTGRIAEPHPSRAFRVSSTLAGLVAGLILIAYGEGLFNATTVEPAPIVRVAPAKIPNAAPPKAGAPAASTPVPRPPSPRSAAAKKRPAGSTRSARAGQGGTIVRPVPHAETPRRRNFLGLRTVADWIAGRNKTGKAGEAGEAGEAGRPGEKGR